MDKPLRSLNENDPLKEAKLNKLQLIMYLLPMVGWVPALVTLSNKNSNTEQRLVSRVSVTLTIAWVVSYGILWLGSLQGSELFTFRLLYFNGLLTSGYILFSLALILRVFQGKLPRWPHR
ncbi:MAG: hypothetical protein AB4041_09280 [Microcystaceae cyanobacterium]